MTAERARSAAKLLPVIHESTVCPDCGNGIDDDGFVTCDDMGLELEPGGTWRELGSRYSCQRCGKQFRGMDIRNSPASTIIAILTIVFLVAALFWIGRN